MATLADDRPAEQAPPPAEAGARGVARVPLWPAVVVFYATLLPREMRLSLGGLEFYADRICLIIVLPFVVQRLIAGALRPAAADVLVLFTGVWMIASMSVNYGFALGLERGGSAALDAMVAYFLARLSFRSVNDVRRVLILLAPGAFLAGTLMVLESVSHVPIVKPLVETVFGRLPYAIDTAFEGAEYHRLGLMRAQGAFSHSILGGLYLATLIALYSLSGLRGWPRWMGLCAGLFGFFSLSSAAVLAMALSFGLVFYDHLQRRVRELSWPLLLSVIAAALIMIHLVSNEGLLGVMIRYLTFNPETGYFRSLTWQFGSASVAAHPWFGIGVEDYARPAWMVSASVDAHWLVLAMRYGLPAALAQGLGVLAALWMLTRAARLAPTVDQRFYHGIAISLSVLSVMMFTVMLWGGTLVWFYLLLGLGVACAQSEPEPVGAEPTRDQGQG